MSLLWLLLWVFGAAEGEAEAGCYFTSSWLCMQKVHKQEQRNTSGHQEAAPRTSQGWFDWRARWFSGSRPEEEQTLQKWRTDTVMEAELSDATYFSRRAFNLRVMNLFFFKTSLRASKSLIWPSIQFVVTKNNSGMWSLMFVYSVQGWQKSIVLTVYISHSWSLCFWYTKQKLQRLMILGSVFLVMF